MTRRGPGRATVVGPPPVVPTDAAGRRAASRLSAIVAEQREMAVLTDEGLSGVAATPSRLGRRSYLAVVATGVVLTLAQLVVLPRFLSAEDFGVVVIAVSVVQGFFQFADLGFARLSDDASAGRAQRDHLRMLSLAASTIALLVVAAAGAALFAMTGAVLGLYVGIAAATAWVLYPTQLRAQASEARGDEVGSAVRHLLWQNVPKLGLVAGAVVTRTAAGCVVGALVVACLVSAPKVCSLRPAREIASLWRRWVPALLAIVAPFVTSWSDTYFVAGRHGLAVAAGYALVYRILAAVSYLYLPFGSLLLTRWNRGEHEAAATVTLSALALCVPVLAGLGGAIVAWSGEFFPGITISPSIVLPLVAMNVFAVVSYLVGTTLAALGRFHEVFVANLAGAAVALGGHLLFTTRMSLAVAARVSCAAMAVAASVQLALAVSAFRARGAVRSP